MAPSKKQGMMRVLVAVPTKREMLYRRAFDSVMALDWDERLDALYLLGGDASPVYWTNQLVKLNQARDVMLANRYDALLTIDSDIIVPIDALRKLSEVEADVVYGTIVLRQVVWHPWNVNTKLDGETMKITFLTDDREAARAAWGKVIDSMGHGQAICFIRRHVLEAFPFRSDKPTHYAADWYLSIDCQQQGFTQKHHLGVICGHIDPDPMKIYWPDPKARNLYRVEMI